MVPRQPKTGHPQFTMRMPPELRDRLQARAELERRSLAQIAAIGLEFYLDHLDKLDKGAKK